MSSVAQNPEITDAVTVKNSQVLHSVIKSYICLTCSHIKRHTKKTVETRIAEECLKILLKLSLRLC